MLENYSIHAAERLVSVKFSGHLTFADLQNYITQLRQNPDFNPVFSELVDLTAVASTELNYGKSAILSDSADPFSLESRRAFVVVNEAVHHVVRIYQMLREDALGIRAFGTIEEAKQWLGVGGHV